MWKNIIIIIMLGFISFHVNGCGGGSSAEQAAIEPTTSTTSTIITTTTAAATTTTTTTSLVPISSGSITGVVTLEGYAEAAGAKVFLEGFSISTFSASDGSYTLNDVPVGTYTIICSKLSFESESITSVEVETGVTTPLSFYLIPTTPPPPPF